MIRNETFADGICISADCYNLTDREYTREEHGIVMVRRPMTMEEWLTYGPQPLDTVGALTTLLVVQGVLPIADAANAINQTPQALIDEAEGWAAAEGKNS